MHEQHFPAYPADLEIRARGDARELYARFPLGKTATIRSAGRVRKERFVAGDGGASMSWQYREFQKLQGELAEMIKSSVDQVRRELLIEQLTDALERRNTHFLVGHSYDRAIASTLDDLALRFSDDAVELRAALAPEGEAPSWVEDAVKAVRGGQLRGISPGFKVGSKGGERLVPELANPGVMVREITDATVFEYSLVSRPSYAGTVANIRSDAPPVPLPRRRVFWL